MRILTRYLLWAHLGPFLFAFGALTGVVLINTLAKRLADLAGKGLPLDVILEFFVLALPATVALTFPMAVLVAVLYTFSTLAAENEITALKASGVDLRRMLLPVLGVGALITVGMVGFNDRVLPEANHQWSQLYLDIARKTPTLAIQAQTLNRITPSSGTGQSFFIRAARVDPASNRLWDVSIFDVSNPSLVRTIFADSGRAVFNATQTDLVMQLFDGHMREVQLDRPEAFRRMEFREQRFGIPGVGTMLEGDSAQRSGYRSDREMTVAMLLAQIDSVNRQQATQRQRVQTIAMADLRGLLGLSRGDSVRADSARRRGDEVWAVAPSTSVVSTQQRTRGTADEARIAIQRIEELEGDTRDYWVEIHKKYSIAVASMVFVIVGAPLALRFGGGGIGMVIASSMVIFALYYVGLIGGEALAGRGYVRPGIAMWCVNVFMTILGAAGLATMGRETSTGRSSALDGLAQAARDLGQQLRRRKAEA